uniref:Fe2OG dioxygenase domain-containing protein n=1 Tax=Oryza punctata TaxID=4537 RepID=A0A0E0JI82_ORYPU
MGSLPVPSVQAMVAATGIVHLVNHNVPEDVVEGMKASIKGFFELPAETKKQVAQEPGQLEGYGQLFVVSDDQKLDWADSLYVKTQPLQDRNLRFWPDQPAGFSNRMCSIDSEWHSTDIAATVKITTDGLLAAMANNLGVEAEVIAERCGGGVQSVRVQYYPPCAQADKVVGISPYSDADLVTILLQANEVDDLQIRRDGAWLPVRPLEGAFIVNLGDILQV